MGFDLKTWIMVTLKIFACGLPAVLLLMFVTPESAMLRGLLYATGVGVGGLIGYQIWKWD